MPKSESLEKLGSIAFLLGNKELPVEISESDYNSYKSIFTDNIVSDSQNAKANDLPDIDDLDDLDLDDDIESSNDIDVKDGLDDIGLPVDLADINENDIDDLGLPTDLGSDEEPSSINKVLEDEKDDFELPDIDIMDDIDNLDGEADNLGIEKNLDFNIDNLLKLDDDIVKTKGSDIENELQDIDTIDIKDTDDLYTDGILNALDDIFEDENTKTELNIDDGISDLGSVIDDIDDIIKETPQTNSKENLNTLAENKSAKDENDIELNSIVDNFEDDISSLVNEKETKTSSNTDSDNYDFDIPDVDSLGLDDNAVSYDNKKDDLLDEDFDLNVDEKEEYALSSDTNELDGNIQIPEYNNDDYLPVEEDEDEDEDESAAKDSTNYKKVLPSPSLANALKESKYGNIDKDIDIDTVLSSIESLPALTQFHVLDAILNEKLNEEDMKTLLQKLNDREDGDAISSVLNKSLDVDIKEHGKKTVAELIPIPEALKDYASIIRTSVLAFAAILIVGLLGFLFVYRPLMSNSYFSRGLKLLNTGAYNEAERLFEKGDKLRPKQIRWYNKYARGYIERETFNPAYQKIQKALEIKPRDFETRITFGYYYRKKGEKDLDTADYNSGETLYSDMIRIIKKKKEVRTIFDERGLLMISRARFLNEPKYLDTAYENYRELIRLQGDSVLARKRGMLVMIYKNNYQQVMALYNHINKLKKGYFDDDVYPILASYVLNNDNFYLARTLFENILKKYPSNITAITGYADYEMRLKHYEKAKEVLIKSALPLYEKNEFLKGKELVYNMLGQISYNTGDYGSAISYFENALKINAIYPDANFNLGNVYYYQQNDYKKAKIYYQTAFANTPPEIRTTQLIYNLSWLYYLDKEYDVAFDGFYSIFDKNSKNPVLSYALGNSLLHLEKENLANGFYNNALSLALEKRAQLGNLEMRTDEDFYLLSYLAALYNNIGVAYANKYINTQQLVNEQEAFKNFVVASEYFDQIRTSRLALQIRDGRTVMLQDQNVGIPLYNLMSMQARRKLNKNNVLVDDFIPKDMYYIKY